MATTTVISKVIVLTGASSGIGASLVQRLGQEPKGTYRLALLSRRREALEEVAKEHFHGGDATVCKVFPCDVTNEKQVHAVAAALLADDAWGNNIDVWINNAGRGLIAKVSELSVEAMNDMMAVNVHSALFGMQAVLPHFKQKAAAQQKAIAAAAASGADAVAPTCVGQIINTSSILGRNATVAPLGVRSAYSGAKHFLNALVDSLDCELRAEFGSTEGVKKVCPIVLTTVSPGMVATDFGVNAGGPDHTVNAAAQPVHEVADVIHTSILEAFLPAATAIATAPALALRSRLGLPCQEYYTRAEHKAWIDNFVTSKGQDQGCIYSALKKD